MSFVSYSIIDESVRIKSLWDFQIVHTIECKLMISTPIILTRSIKEEKLSNNETIFRS